jgi:UDP-N-acetyl-2-amino-2-deoxyglucuronate dehydrogenase
MTIHIGILGGGNISETHARAVREIEGAQITAVCGQNLDKVKRLAEEYRGSAYENPENFFKHKPMDVVLIGSPSGLHAEHGIAAARHRVHVLVEKPLAITLEQTDALIAACEDAGVKLAVLFQDRVAPDITRLKQLVDKWLGRPILASARVKWYRPPDYYKNSRWRGTWALDGGGALMNQGVHTVDLLLWLIGDVKRVWATGSTAIHDIEVEDTIVATLEFSNGAIGTLEAATSAYPGYARRLELTGSGGTVIVENDRIISADLREPSDELRETRPTEQTANDQRSVSPIVSDTSGHRRLIENFLQTIDDGRVAVCDGREGRRSVELVRAIYESWRTGKPVEVKVSPAATH